MSEEYAVGSVQDCPNGYPAGTVSYCYPCARKYFKKYNAERYRDPEKYAKELERNRTRYQTVIRKGLVARKKALVIAMGGCCEFCGYNKNISALEFDHMDPAEKCSGLALLLHRQTPEAWEDAKKEAAKCLLLCANCHRERTHPSEDFLLP